MIPGAGIGISNVFFLLLRMSKLHMDCIYSCTIRINILDKIFETFVFTRQKKFPYTGTTYNHHLAQHEKNNM